MATTYPRPQAPQDDDPLNYEKAPSLSFRDAPIGTIHTGIITKKATLVQSRDYETGDPATWPDGNPKMSVVIQLEVDGEPRSLWAPKPSAMFQALVNAQKEAGGHPMQVGGTLHVKFIGTTPSTNPRKNDAKQYACKYVPPSESDPFNNDMPSNASPTKREPSSMVASPPAPARPATPGGKKGW